MKPLNDIDMAALAAKQLQKPCMYINFTDSDWDELILAAPYLNIHDHAAYLLNESLLLVFDTVQEMEEAYWSTVGDDGPTDTNPYNGPVRVYALTISPEGIFLNENT